MAYSYVFPIKRDGLHIGLPNQKGWGLRGNRRSPLIPDINVFLIFLLFGSRPFRHRQQLIRGSQHLLGNTLINLHRDIQAIMSASLQVFPSAFKERRIKLRIPRVFIHDRLSLVLFYIIILRRSQYQIGAVEAAYHESFGCTDNTRSSQSPV